MSDDEVRIEYPCPWSMRVVAPHDERVVVFVGSVLTRHVEDFDPDSLAVVPSREGRFMSVRLTFAAVSESHVQTIVEELAAHPDVRMII